MTNVAYLYQFMFLCFQQSFLLHIISSEICFIVTNLSFLFIYLFSRVNDVFNLFFIVRICTLATEIPSRQYQVESQQNNIRATSRDVAPMLFLTFNSNLPAGLQFIVNRDIQSSCLKNTFLRIMTRVSVEHCLYVFVGSPTFMQLNWLMFKNKSRIKEWSTCCPPAELRLVLCYVLRLFIYCKNALRIKNLKPEQTKI